LYYKKIQNKCLIDLDFLKSFSINFLSVNISHLKLTFKQKQSCNRSVFYSVGNGNINLFNLNNTTIQLKELRYNVNPAVSIKKLSPYSYLTPQQ